MFQFIIMFNVYITLTLKFPSLAEQPTFLGDRILITFETSFITLFILTSLCFVL